jgi:hypothetical protein
VNFASRSLILAMMLAALVATGVAQTTNESLGSYKVEKTLLGPWDRSLFTQPFLLNAPDAPPGCGAGCGLGGIAFALLWDAAALSSRPVYVLSSDGLHFAYVSLNKHVCGEGPKICVVVDGQVKSERDLKSIGYLAFAGGNRRFTYKVKRLDGQWSVETLALQGDRWTPVSDVQAGPADEPPAAPLNSAQVPIPQNSNSARFGPVHSPDGTRTAEVEFKRGWKAYSVVVDGQTSAKYVMIGRGSPVFSPDSKHVAFTASKGGGEVVVVDTKEGREYLKVNLPIFSPNSEHFAYLAETHHFSKPWTVVLDDRECGNFVEAGVPTFSADGRHMIFLATSAMSRNKWSVVLDGVPGEEFDGLLAGVPIFKADGALDFLAHEGDSLYRVKYTPRP